MHLHVTGQSRVGGVDGAGIMRPGRVQFNFSGFSLHLNVQRRHIKCSWLWHCRQDHMFSWEFL